MREHRNRYCSRCLRTRRFLDEVTHETCTTCGKRYEKVVVPAAHTAVIKDAA